MTPLRFVAVALAGWLKESVRTEIKSVLAQSERISKLLDEGRHIEPGPLQCRLRRTDFPGGHTVELEIDGRTLGESLANNVL